MKFRAIRIGPNDTMKLQPGDIVQFEVLRAKKGDIRHYLYWVVSLIDEYFNVVYSLNSENFMCPKWSVADGNFDTASKRSLWNITIFRADEEE